MIWYDIKFILNIINTDLHLKLMKYYINEIYRKELSMSVFEAGMMVCFGISWPVAALKTYRCKCVHGKSIHFSMLILLGYICGITHKVLDDMDWVFWLYILNTIFLLIDMFLYWKYKDNKAPVEEDVEINEAVDA